MSNRSGTYKLIDGEIVKVSGKIPNLRSNIYWKETDNHSGYYSEACDTHFRSKNHKRQVLKERNWAEAG